MPSLETLLTFIPVALALNLTPGADMLFCLGQGARSGPLAGITAALGIALGGMGHALAAGLGLAALIAASPAAFEALRWAGVAYLSWLGIKALRAPAPDPQAATRTGHAPFRPLHTLREALGVSLLNPKVAAFMLALVPQFIVPADGPVWSQFLAFGAVIGCGGVLVNGTVGAMAGRISAALARRRGAGGGRAMQRLSGGVFLALAATLAFTRRAGA
ncbi:LysE family translocator [Rhodovulum sp. DZ06]|uniref:LysE family translocator n=1 Tax=Rhodovulum sp. DZ06 TaxID=3425126 RepID=UPI003D357507